MYYILYYLILANLAGLILMGLDTSKARRHRWRIPERMLFLSAVLGGSLGATVGMWIFRHKTQHWYFVVGMPAILILQVAAYILLRP